MVISCGFVGRVRKARPCRVNELNDLSERRLGLGQEVEQGENVRHVVPHLQLGAGVALRESHRVVQQQLGAAHLQQQWWQAGHVAEQR
jgi:hypothetical protein